MSEAKPLPPVEVLREFFNYDPETGIIYRRKKSARCHVVGEQVGCAQGCYGVRTYLTIQFQYQQIKLHRLAWKLQTGEEPPQVIDHANGDHSDNRWENLRAASASQNSANWHRQSRYKRGVQLRRSGRWNAYGGGGTIRRVYLGTYETEEEAHQAHVRWSLQQFGEFSIYAAAVATAI